MDMIENNWTGAGVEISLCEDLEKSAEYTIDNINLEEECTGYEHVVKGGDRGIEHDLEQSSAIGCGGCCTAR